MTRSQHKLKRKKSDPSWSPTPLVKIEEEDPQDAPFVIRAQQNDFLDDFDPDCDDLDSDLQLEEDIRLEQQLQEQELLRNLSPGVAVHRTPWLHL